MNHNKKQPTVLKLRHFQQIRITSFTNPEKNCFFKTLEPVCTYTIEKLTDGKGKYCEP